MESFPKKTILAGAILAAVVTMLPFPRFVFGYMGTLLHEFGHTVAAWLFSSGYSWEHKVFKLESHDRLPCHRSVERVLGEVPF